MALSKNIKKGTFWINVCKVGFVFLIISTIISLLMYSFKDVFSGNLKAVIETNFSNGQWKRFFISKIIIISLLTFFFAKKMSLNFKKIF